jgi:hypothetical protein
MAEAFGSLLPQRADGLRVLEAKMLLVLSGGGSGGLLTNEVASGAGAPAHTPSITTQLYVDTNTGTLYEWYSSAWH